jgi:acyl-coenzyme A synthetase/AMP-(fatty) acid ligase
MCIVKKEDKDKIQSLIVGKDMLIVVYEELEEYMLSEEDCCSSFSLDNPISYGIYTSGSTGFPKCVLISHFSINLFINGKN